MVAEKFAADSAHNTVSVHNIPDTWMGLDVGPKTIETIKASLQDCKTVIWNGPMGMQYDRPIVFNT